MAQHDYIIANQSGAAFRSDLNNGLAAIVSQNSGAAQPSTTYAYQWWADTATGLLKLRNAANNAWITIGTLADANLGLLSLAGGTLTGALLVDDSGTAALPAIAFDGDTNTGIFRPAADQLGIATNGVERVEFGTTEVVFNDDGADVDFRVEGDTNASLFKIDAGLDQVQVANLNGGPLAGTRNRIINGGFDIWQRGTSQTTTGYGSADRWNMTVTGTTTFSQETSIVPSGAQYALKWTTGAASSYGQVRQYIEQLNVIPLRGQTVTASAYVRSGGTFAGNYLFEIGYNTSSDASGASWSIISTTTSGTINSSSYTQIKATFTVPSNAVGLYFGLVPDTVQASGAIVYQSLAQLEPGSTATPFERRSYGQELALCQRYYWKTYLDNTVPGSVSQPGAFMITVPFVGNSVRLTHPFKVQMRAAPTFTFYNPETGTAGFAAYEASGATNQVGMSQTYTSEYAGLMYATSAGFTGSLYWHAVGAAEL
jgi:hypothetical protein